MSRNKTTYNIAILGNSNIGKTSFLYCLNGAQFSEKQVSTIGIDTFILEKNDKNNNKIYLKLHDTSGQEMYRSLSLNLLKKLNAIIFFYDITKEKSFSDIKDDWFKKCNDIINPNEIVIILIGNKTDLESERSVSYDEAENFAKTYNMEFFEISVKTNNNVQEVLYSLTNNLVQKFGYKSAENTSENIKISSKNIKKKKKIFC